MINALIIDDEQHAIDSIRILLEEFQDKITVVGSALSVAQGISSIHELKPDLVFLDIELKDGIGFEVVEKTKDVSYKLIFTTAYNQYAIRAFKVRALDYLLKPIDLTEFRDTLRILIDEVGIHTSLQVQQSYDDAIKVTEMDGYILVPVEDILYLQADSNYTRIHSKKGKTYLLAKTLKEFSSKLNPAQFARVHHSYIINKKEIKQLSKGSKNEVLMNNDVWIPISRSRKGLLW